MIPRRIFLFFLTGLLLTLFTVSPSFAAPDPMPILTLEPGRHVAQIQRMAVDRPERYAVTASDDKTLRVWDIRNQGKLLRTIRPPIGKGNEGKLYAVAISPDGEVIAAGGWTADDSFYLFKRSNGHMIRRIRGLPNVINDLVFSYDGRKLAVALGGSNGIRVFDSATGRALSSDTQYSGISLSVDFDKQGRLVSASYDGVIRLYDPSFRLLKRYRAQGGNRPYSARFSPDGRKIAVGFENSTQVEVLAAHDLSPLPSPNTSGISKGSLGTIAWSNNGRWIYAGGTYTNGRGIPVLMLPQAGGQRRVIKASDSSIRAIHPMRDGGVLYASGDPTIGRLNAAGQTLWRRTSGKLDLRGYQARRNFKLSADGSRVWFHYEHEREPNGQIIKGTVGRDLNTQTLFKSASPDMQIPRLQANGLQIRNWENETNPTLNGRALNLKQYETSRSLAIAPGNRGFALGASWYLRYFEANGQQRWQEPVSLAWAVNVSQSGRWVVAALGDGAIRWYEANTGNERLAFYLHPDQKRWIAWTPDGFYSASSENAERLMGYHLNNGADKEAQFVRVDQLKKVYARKDLVARALQPDYPRVAQQTLQHAGDVRRLLRADRLPPTITITGSRNNQFNQQGEHFALPFEIKNRGGGIGRVEYRIAGKVYDDPASRGTGAHSAGGRGIVRKKRSFTLPHGRTVMEVVAYDARNKVASEPVKVVINMNNPVRKRPSLYVLSIGVTDYDDDSLDLRYAASDAKAFAETLEQHTGPAIYQQIHTTLLQDRDVNLHRIRQELTRLATVVQPQDVFVLYLAGHGKSLDGRYHFLPQNLRFTGNQAIRQHGLSDEKLRDWLTPIKARKNLMVLDTCNAGKSIQQLAMARGILEDKVAIANLMDSTGFAVLAASTAKQQAFAGIVDHNTNRGNGLFTYVLLDGLRGSADKQRVDRRVSIRELRAHIDSELPRLSQLKWGFKQVPMSQVTGDDFIVSRRLQ
ncbi:caspase family protein [Leucothrix pacifica]|uniref:Peptidase C14 caspase domain-containing protein n=1 Tax=Leucothrix pacifica TaxID=1247513 RepID=A0A317CMC5_9GAMM|nr:caspase family protein [Leucothrix pacifica]PWQ99676.1 hypothetical protein DKW60_05205 [Leucothrix pacifica]